jgi:hypothetical protein
MIVKGVRVTIGARVLGISLGGERTAINTNMGTERTAIRGTLARMVTIPSALQAFRAVPSDDPVYAALHWE